MNESLMTGCVGLDVGGANVKAFYLPAGPSTPPLPRSGVARTLAFAVWKQPERLACALADLLNAMPAYDVLAVTMTAELCDCFETKREGVNAVLDSVAAASLGQRVFVWQTSGRFVELGAARETWMQTAAANWLALATYAGRFARQGRALLIDVGSTTTDIIPLCDGVPVPAGRTDHERLASGELVYGGVRRTPLCALVREVPWHGRLCAVAAEWFATTRDVYLLLGDLEEDTEERDTADGRPATRSCAHGRLARVVCADRALLTRAEVTDIAEAVAETQVQQGCAALERVVERLGGAPETVVVSGEGEFLARRFVEAVGRDTPKPRIVSLAKELGGAASEAACAYAVAVLARENICEQGIPQGRPASLAEQQASRKAPVVIKVGGSLLDLEDLPQRLRAFLHGRSGDRPLLVVGGGRSADAVRELDRRHQLVDDASHWLAVRAMGFNARMLEALLEEARVVTSPCDAQRCWNDGHVPILDPWEMLQQAERDGGAEHADAGFVLPHRWEVTSDSIAAWAARCMGARELVLLKSADHDGSATVEQAVRLGFVDHFFERASAGLPAVTYVNLRAPVPSEIALRHGAPDRASS